MAALLMAKPKESASQGDFVPRTGSSTVRLSADLAYMVGWICEIEELTSIELLDPLLRKSVEARFERIRPTVQQIEELKRKGKPKEG